MKTKYRNNLIIVVCILLITAILAGVLTKFHSSPGGVKGEIQDAVSFITEPIMSAANGIRSGFQGILGFKAQMRENEALKEENQKLQQQNMQLKLDRKEKEELEQLCSIFDYQMPAERQIIAANVSGVDYSRWEGVFLIDKGSSDGIQKGAAVVSGDGLVGKVSQVSGQTAKVISILADQTKVSFQIEGRSGETGMLQSDGAGKLRGYLLAEDDAPEKGERLVTSGIGTYPSGLFIGTVIQVQKEEDGLGIMIEASPAVSFFSLTKVGIIK